MTDEEKHAKDSKNRAIGITKRKERRILDGFQIVTTDPTPDEWAFMAREFVLCTLPHRNPGDVAVWSRTNGNLTLGIQAGANLETKKSYGYPYGSIPRLLLAWVTTEATRTKSHRLELGANLNSFMSALGLSANTGRGKRGDAKRLRDQMDRLFNANISFQYATKGERRSGAARLNMQIARKSVFWWSEKNPQQSVLWDSWIELTEEFYKAVTAEPLPLDVRILKHIKQSPLAIDLYTILNREAYRASKGGKPRFLAWKWLQAQIGNEYGDSRNFRAKALIQIQHILDVNPHLLLKQEKGRSGQKSGLTISNLSLPSIRPKD